MRLAVEELVDRLGDFLGLSTTREDGDDGHALWLSAHGGQQLTVMVVDSTRAVPVSARASRSRSPARLVTVSSEQQLTCLYVVCGTVNERLLNEAVHLRHATRQVRFITVDALIGWPGWLNRARVGRTGRGVLRPASALADPVIALLPSTDDGDADRPSVSSRHMYA